MAAQSSPRKSPAAASVGRDHASNNQHAQANSKTKSSTLSADFARRKSVVSDPEEMLLLREKLNQIAVGLQFGSAPHDDDCDGEDEEDEEQSERRRRRQHGRGHFKVFPLLGERPSTPPSSPQPRDVLRKQMRLRNSSFRLDDLPSHRRGASFNDFEDALDGVCVDAVVTRYDGNAQSASVRMSIPGHLRVRSASSFSVLTKNPEGLRKRKSSHVDDKDPDGEDTTPLKKVSSQKNILASPSTWDYDAVAAATGAMSNQTAAQQNASQKDHEMEDVSSESPDSVIFVGEMGKHRGRGDMSTPCS